MIFAELAEKYGVSQELARRIIFCESGDNPWALNTKAKIGIDIGIWQLNSYFWTDKLYKMGWNIYEPRDNLEAGFWLLSTKGTSPWNWSKHCWGNE